ncbi:hypothetical protein [Streptomyces sp. SID13726]|uniref:hypothetical protein n=1 Tax=Streptomyces sp. SID13726 TaxID=2706058 RepID=UPI0013BA8377|nr:hypothetical protein [Streptomyces sp. SID13726]NEA99001.1 hypothetical protein [Streptomyces sp. SID13726]
MSTATDNCAATPTGGDHSTVGDGTSGYSRAQPNTLTGTSTTGGTTSYIYDAGGNLLLQTDPITTLCVGSEQITITLDDLAGTVTGGATIVRTGVGTQQPLPRRCSSRRMPTRPSLKSSRGEGNPLRASWRRARELG